MNPKYQLIELRQNRRFPLLTVTDPLYPEPVPENQVTDLVYKPIHSHLYFDSWFPHFHHTSPVSHILEHSIHHFRLHRALQKQHHPQKISAEEAVQTPSLADETVQTRSI